MTNIIVIENTFPMRVMFGVVAQLFMLRVYNNIYLYMYVCKYISQNDITTQFPSS